MVKKVWRRVTATVLSAALIWSAGILPASAAESGSTIKGAAETIRVSSGAASDRETSFNDGWKFYLGDNSSAMNVNFDDSGWKAVTLPHDFSISQNFTTSGEAESGFLPGGTGWYRKSFVLPAGDAGKTLLLNFDGVYSDAYVYVNGTLVGENHYGYSSFAIDISNFVTCDGTTENVIAVKAVNTVPSSRWYSGSGIYRDVTLIAADPVHIAHNGTYVTTPDIAKGIGTVQVQVEVQNDSSASAEVTVKNTVYAADGTAASGTTETTATVGAGAVKTVPASPVVGSPALWSPDAPKLYTVHTEVYSGGQLTDSYDTTFGFRYFSFDSSGFHLNGKNVKLNGVCLHHDQGALGSAASYDAMYRQLAKMKDMGVNAIRTSHNPADEDFIDICNELGLLVVEELFDGWVDAKNGNSNDFSRYFSQKVSNGPYGTDSSMTWAEAAAKSTVRRDRNDPSVILWSLGNEVQEGTNGSQVSSYAAIAQNIINWIKAEDTTRPATSGDNTRGGNSNLVNVLNTIRNNGGVVGFNYANDTGTLSSLAQNYGGGVIIASETSSATNSRGQYRNQSNNSNSDGKYHLTSYDTSAVSWGITAHGSIYNTYQLDCVAGEFVWTGWDYIGEPTPWNGTGSGSVSSIGAAPNSSYFGIVDTAGFEKDTYYLYRSQWNKDSTTLHLVTAWDSDNMYTTGSKTPVVIYSNAPEVKLYRNGDLIGTATRSTHTSSAGHTYYTYSVSSNSNRVCTAVSASGAASLYATFNVTYAEGTISAKAYDENGREITKTAGSSAVSTPGTVSKLQVTQDKTVVDADGQSLVYVEVEVQDADGHLDTTAANTIQFSLSGNGEIVGVDNGDQATTSKFQQSRVLTGSKSAHIAAYAGKALVIVRSTKDAGSFTVNVSASGLTGGSASVTTKAVEDGGAQTGLTSYTMVRDYSVKAGTKPALETTASGTMADGSAVSGTIEWENVSKDIYGKAGDYTINGTLNIVDQAIAVSAKLHVIADVIALRNVSTATSAGTAPVLPNTVRGVLADGTLSGEFSVNWETVSESQFATVGELVTVHGTAAVFGTETLPVTCTVRVAKMVNTESSNVAPAAVVTQDIAAGYTSDALSAVNNGNTTFADNTAERWSNWNNRTRSAAATLTFTWATAQLLESANLYYYYDNCAAYPENIEFQYSLNGTDYTTIGCTSKQVQTNTLGAEYTYTFEKPINPVAVRIIFTQQGGTSGSHCVALIEAEMMTFAGALEYNDSAALSGITVDGTGVSGFDADTLDYEAKGTTIAATTDVNAGITVLPALDHVVRILTVSEDGSAARTYAVTVNGEAACTHAHTELQNAREATCKEEGYTGDLVCKDCGETIEAGTVTPKTDHKTVLQNAKEATCKEAGYTGNLVCTVCGETIETGTVTPKTDHKTELRNAKEATCKEAGYTGDLVCTVCGETIETGTGIPKTDHKTVLRNAKEATCKEEGYTGDLVCTVCGETIETGTGIPKTEHKWDNGVVTKPATATEEGTKLYTCTVCGATKEEPIPAEKKLKEPSLSLTLKQYNGKIRMIAAVDDYDNRDDYYQITGHGFLYITKTRLGMRTLSVSTPGRTRVTINNFISDGSYIYSFSPTSANTKYAIRAYLIYRDENGTSHYVYTDKLIANYAGLSGK